MTSSAVYRQSRHSGDINFVAALMALGIPLDPDDPVAMVEHEKRGTYASFYLGEYSDNGAETAETLAEYWSGQRPIPDGHGFQAVCDFIRARPQEIQKSDDLLAFAIDYLRERCHALPGLRKMDDVPAFVNALPDSDASHILAYVYNRDLCYKLYLGARRKLYFETGDGRDTRRALIDSRLPRWQAKELLSRLQG